MHSGCWNLTLCVWICPRDVGVPIVWGAHAPSRAGDGALAIANFPGMRETLQFEVRGGLPRRRGKQHARARALPEKHAFNAKTDRDVDLNLQ